MRRRRVIQQLRSDNGPCCSPHFPELSPLIGVGFRKLGTEQEDLGRIIDPYQHDDESARGAVSRRHITASDVKANQMLANCEQYRRYRRAKPNLLPFDPLVRKYFEDHGEEHGCESKRE